MIPQNIQWTTRNPGLLIILVDQTIMASWLCILSIVNRIINDIVQLCFDGKRPKISVMLVSVIGYNNEVKIITSGSFEYNRLQVPLICRKIFKASFKCIGQLLLRVPVWAQSEFISVDKSDMYGALEVSNGVIQEWIEQYQERPASIMLNVAAGIPYGSFF